MRSHLLRVRLGMVTAMAKVIEFCVPEKFRKQSGKWISPEQRGTFRLRRRKTNQHDTEGGFREPNGVELRNCRAHIR
jgi:hypothetical protein